MFLEELAEERNLLLGLFGVGDAFYLSKVSAILL